MSELEAWFNTFFWPTYPADLTHKKKGPKSVALKAFVKLNPDANLRQDIMAKLEVLIRSARAEKRVGKEPDRWPFASTWINQERWNCIEDLKATTTIARNSKCNCGAEATHGNNCDKCYHREADKRYDKEILMPALEKLGLAKPERGANSERIYEWQMACRQWCTTNTGRVLGKVVGGGA